MTAPPAARQAFRQALAGHITGAGQTINWERFRSISRTPAMLDQALDAAFEAMQPLSEAGYPAHLTGPTVDDLIAAAVQAERQRIVKHFADGGSWIDLDLDQRA